ncbi:MAG: GTPase ObgE [Desulfurivibrionaceae bacterium]|jgi:GTP-binding protein
MAFIDEAKFFVKAGDGGNGCLSFRREKFVPKGGPDGGDGGDGGSVTIEASRKLASLLDFRFKSHFLAQNGTPGRGKRMYGRKGEDFTLYVPLGSILRDAETGEILAELLNDGDRFLAARGGEGGKGNVHFASAQNRAPRIATKGKEGEERWFRIELKLLADIGLIGLPNAGKSTLLSKLSAANPKVADYPFTTLEPQLGVMHLPDADSCIIADIPGLIEGAHTGAGLGHKFLRHVERTQILLHVIDASTPDEQPLQEYRTLENELRVYNDELMDRQRLVVLNKIDLLEDEQRLGALQELFLKAEGIKPLAISALTGQGLAQLQEALGEMLELRKVEAQEAHPADEDDSELVRN